MGRPHDHERRRLDRQGDRARRPLGEDRRRARQGGRQEDRRRRRRRHDDGDRARPGDREGRPAQRRGRRQPDGPQARHRARHRARRRGASRTSPRTSTTKEQIANVGAISAADPEIGEKIAEAVDKVGKDGVITVEESNTFGMELDFVEGMRFDKGYISPYFVTDPERMEAVLEEPYILIANSKISARQGPAPAAREGHADRQAGPGPGRGRRGRGPGHARGQQDPWHVQVRRGQGPRVRRPPQGDAAGHRDPHRRPGDLRGGRPQARERHARPARAPPARSSSRRTRPRSCEGAGKDEDIKGRINQIKSEIEKTDSDYDREKLQERLAKLSGGVAVIKVGAATEVELKEKKHRIEDAVQSTKAAVEEGIVPGGGVALLNAQAALDKHDLEGDELTGAAIVRRALEEPIKQIAFNAGLEGGVDRREGPCARPGSRPERRQRRVRRHAQVRRHRPDQGDALGVAERGVDRARCS